MSGCLTLEPDPRRWRELAFQQRDFALFGRPIQEWTSLTRGELGLPQDGLLIGTGHQAGLWHPGILAKYIAASELSRAVGQRGAGWAHVVVDQDVNDAAAIDVPLSGADGVTRVQRLRLLEHDRSKPTAAAPPQLPRRFEGEDRPFAIHPAARRDGLELMQESLRAEPHRRSLAAQLAAAVQRCMQPWAPGGAVVFATDLLRTALGASLIESMRRDPEACAGAYNAASLAAPDAGIAPLERRGAVVELPLWRIDAEGRRHRVFIDDLDDDDIDPAQLAPRALLMTAILRIAVFDLFIHGRGGWMYDRVMERWVAGWLGAACAPMTIASADLHLPFGRSDGCDDMHSVEEAQHALRRAWHDPPAAEDDARPSSQKQRLLRAISEARSAATRRSAFHEMHEALGQWRERLSPRIEERRRDVERARRCASARAIHARRDWAFPLYPRRQLDELAREIRAAIRA